MSYQTESDLRATASHRSPFHTMRHSISFVFGLGLLIWMQTTAFAVQRRHTECSAVKQSSIGPKFNVLIKSFEASANSSTASFIGGTETMLFNAIAKKLDLDFEYVVDEQDAAGYMGHRRPSTQQVK